MDMDTNQPSEGEESPPKTTLPPFAWMRQHDLQTWDDGSLRCVRCLYIAKPHERGEECPPVPGYSWETVPPDLRTIQQLRTLQLDRNGPVRGFVWIEKQSGYPVWLYSVLEAVPATRLTPIQLAGTERLRANWRYLKRIGQCRTCGQQCQLEWHQKRCTTCVQANAELDLLAMKQSSILYARRMLARKDSRIVALSTTRDMDPLFRDIHVAVIDGKHQVRLTKTLRWPTKRTLVLATRLTSRNFTDRFLARQLQAFYTTLAKIFAGSVYSDRIVVYDTGVLRRKFKRFARLAYGVGLERTAGVFRSIAGLFSIRDLVSVYTFYVGDCLVSNLDATRPSEYRRHYPLARGIARSALEEVHATCRLLHSMAETPNCYYMVRR